MHKQNFVPMKNGRFPKKRPKTIEITQNMLHKICNTKCVIKKDAAERQRLKHSLILDKNYSFSFRILTISSCLSFGVGMY